MSGESDGEDTKARRQAMDQEEVRRVLGLMEQWTLMLLERAEGDEVRPGHRILVVTGEDLRRVEGVKLVGDLPDEKLEPWRFAFYFGESLLGRDRREEGVREMLKNLGEDLRSDNAERQARAATMVYFLEKFFDRAVIHGKGLEAAAMKKTRGK